mmetsp:Transcript_26296/g.54181  ORF Transcript_26296/g.54181 Transcript_26296/m.54181 type:complete len:224 (+) Transcript_26296:350-1021(+)
MDRQGAGFGAGIISADHRLGDPEAKRHYFERSPRHRFRAIDARRGACDTRTPEPTGVVRIEDARYDRNGKIPDSQFQRNTLLAGCQRERRGDGKDGDDSRNAAPRLSARDEARCERQIPGGDGSRFYHQRPGGVERKVLHGKLFQGAGVGEPGFGPILVAGTLLHHGEPGPRSYHRRRSKGHQVAKLAGFRRCGLLHRKRLDVGQLLGLVQNSRESSRSRVRF